MLLGPQGEIRVVLFDLDDTLVPWQTLNHWQWAWRPRGPVLSERHVRAALRRSLHSWDRRRWRGLVGAEPPTDLSTLRQHLKATLSAVAGHELPEAESEAVLGRFLHPAGEIETFPDVAPALRDLTAAGVRIAVVTPLPIEVARWSLRRAQIPEPAFLLAGDDPEGPPVPAKQAFRKAVEQTGVGVDSGLYVGDLFWSDVRAATRAGLLSVLLDRTQAFPKVGGRKVGSLSGLGAVLAQPSPPVPETTDLGT